MWLGLQAQLELKQQGSIHTKGCYVDQFDKWLQDNLNAVAGVFVAVTLLQIFGISLAQSLVNDIKAVKANWGSFHSGHGYLPTQ